jgi:hypothetical protein
VIDEAVATAHGQPPQHTGAWVELPEWFEALNGDFRYQLTAMGAPAPGLHIAEEITDHRFRIAGGEAGMKVSWQVTGTRRDGWAAANPFEAEQVKPAAERGRYLQPGLYDAPDERRIVTEPIAATLRAVSLTPVEESTADGRPSAPASGVDQRHVETVRQLIAARHEPLEALRRRVAPPDRG